jgi:hypothetical protein
LHRLPCYALMGTQGREGILAHTSDNGAAISLLGFMTYTSETLQVEHVTRDYHSPSIGAALRAASRVIRLRIKEKTLVWTDFARRSVCC